MLRIRLQRFGKKKAPVYRIVAIEKAQKRQGKPTEVLGFYDPHAKLLVYNTERAKHWKSVGAQPTETAEYLLSKEPKHDLKDGPYKSVALPRTEKEKIKADILKQSTKNTKAKKKHAEAAVATKQAKEEEAAAPATEEASAEAPATEETPAAE